MLDRTPILSRSGAAVAVAGFGLLLTTGTLFGQAAPLSGQATPQPDPFPLEIGNSWTYAGTVWWMPRYSRRIYEERVELETEVIDLIERPGVRAAILVGHPHDLIATGRGRSRQPYLLVQIGADRLYLLQGARYYEALNRLRDPRDSLVGLVDDPELLLDLPLFEGKRLLCPDASLPRRDGLGCWTVRSEKLVDLTAIWGLNGSRKRERYTLDLLHRGEHDVWGFVPGVGFTFYGVGSPGDPSAVELDLIEIRLVEPPVHRLATTVHLGETAVHRIEGPDVRVIAPEVRVDAPARPVDVQLGRVESRHPRVEAALRRLDSPGDGELAGSARVDAPSIRREPAEEKEPVLLQAVATAELPDPSPPPVPVVAVAPDAVTPEPAEPRPLPELPACLDDRREWVREHSAIEVEGQAFEPIGQPEPVNADNLVRVAEHDGVPLNVGKLASPPYVDLWLPRCDPQDTYNLYTRSTRASGADH